MPAPRRAAVALVACLLLGGVRADEKKADKEAAVKREWKRLNGTWEFTGSVSDGKKEAPKERVTLTLKDGKYTFMWGGKVVDEWALKIDPTSSPKSMDLTPSSGPTESNSYRAIYELKGNTLRVCLGQRGKPRPKAFEAKAGSGHTLVTYKRLTPKD